MSIIAPPIESPDPIIESTSRKKLWQYDPDLYGKRDLRIDFLRGVAIFSMVVNHLECRSYFNKITQNHSRLEYKSHYFNGKFGIN